ncbi:MAG: LamG-like jellyroll fold domain-containing protein [Paludibacter sp.]
MKKIITSLMLAILFGLSANAQVPTNGLVAYYPFNGNANDASGYGNNGTVYGTTLTTDRFGNVNRAYYFDGSTNYIDVPNSSSLNFTNQFTISSWIKTNFSSDWQRIVDKGQQATSNGYVLDMIGNSVRLNANYQYTTNATICNNTWKHIVSVYNNGVVQIYIDGILNSTITSTATSLVACTNNLKIGKANGNLVYFHGNIDDIRIYNRALNQNEVTALYNDNAVDIYSGLVAYYPFNGNANDASGYGNNGTVYNATLTTDRFSNANKAYSFDGSSSYIDVPNSTSLNFTNQFTISSWIKTNFTTDWQRIVDKGQQATSNGYVLDMIGNSVRLNANYEFTTNATITNNTWKHIVTVYYNGVAQIYIDGILNNTITSTATSLVACTNNIKIGKANGNLLYFHGSIDDIRIYNRNLNQSEVTTLYNEGVNYAGFESISFKNIIKVYPNPTSETLTIDCGTNYNPSKNYKVRIVNNLGQSIYESIITQQVSSINLNNRIGKGIFIIQLIDSNSNILDNKKIVLQ